MRKVAIVIGHSRKSVGACNQTHSVCEHQWNGTFAEDLAKMLDIDCEIVHRDSLMTLPGKINDTNAGFVIALHCNAYNTKAAGCETLYYHKSKTGKKIAAILQKKVVSTLFNRDRGIKPKSSEDRGGFLLRYTKAPCLIAEPFFIDNDIDYMNAKQHREALLVAFKEAIEEIARTI